MKNSPMAWIERRLHPTLESDLNHKMILLSGPRQCGKTSLTKSLVRSGQGRYFSWDDPLDRKNILNFNPNLDSDFWVFDEIHKFKRWRGFLKGLFDRFSKSKKILVTGSAKLELYSRGGDSLQGRYFLHHLHPFTMGELLGTPIGEPDEWMELPIRRPKAATDTLKNLLVLGGFPEPFLSGSDRESKRWRLQYGNRLVQEEVAALERIEELERLELLFDRLGDIAGSVVSLNSLREDLDVAFGTVKKWLSVLERLDSVFRVAPFGPAKIKTVKKEQKLYFWDWPRAASEGARFENLIAMHLLRMVDWMNDLYGEKTELRYFRNRPGHEVDFVVLKNSHPWFAVEVKLSETALSPSLKYLLERLPPGRTCSHAFQVVLNPKQEFEYGKIGTTKVSVVSAERFLINLP
jgi:predicted AAA+ superfamily ATPase